jgi:hypothetical protein
MTKAYFYAEFAPILPDAPPRVEQGECQALEALGLMLLALEELSNPNNRKKTK